MAGPRETVPEEGAQTEALWQDPASPHPLEMEVVYGYDNTARSGRILPMTIRVTNSTKEDFTGTLRAATLEPEYSPYGNSSLSEYSTYRYEYPIEVKAGETVEKKIQISLSIQVDQVLLSLVDQEGKAFRMVAQNPHIQLRCIQVQIQPDPASGCLLSFLIY